MEQNYVLSDSEHMALIKEVFNGHMEYVNLGPLVSTLQGRIKIYSKITLNSNNYAYIDFTDYDVHIVLNGPLKNFLPIAIRQIVEQEEQYFKQKENALFQATYKYKYEKFGKPYAADFSKYIDKVDKLQAEIRAKEQQKLALGLQITELQNQITTLEDDIEGIKDQIPDLKVNPDTSKILKVEEYAEKLENE